MYYQQPAHWHCSFLVLTHLHAMHTILKGRNAYLTYVNEINNLDRSMTNYHGLQVEYIHISANYDDALTCYCWLESWETLESSSSECKSHVDNLRPVYLLLLQVLHIPGNTNQIKKDAVEHKVLKFISTHSLL